VKYRITNNFIIIFLILKYNYYWLNHYFAVINIIYGKIKIIYSGIELELVNSNW
jgi:hypothetical protein